MVSTMRVTVVGAGGVGGYFGGRLAQSGVDVSFLAREGPHLEALRTTGLRVRSVRGDFTVPVTATADPAVLEKADYVLVTVKSYDTDQVASRLRDLRRDDTAVVSLQNGVDNEEKLAAVVGAQHVIGGAAYIFATIAEPGVIAHTGGPASIVVGEWGDGEGDESRRVASLVELFARAGVSAEASPDIRAVLWSKFAFICAQAGVTAATRLPIGEIRAQPASRQLFADLASEVCAVAAAEGVRLSTELPQRTLAFADALEPGGFSSLHHDLVSGRRMELDALLGEVVRRGERLGVAVPASRAVYGVLQPWAARVTEP
jgi:2-dehydropantoate 2-reductase